MNTADIELVHVPDKMTSGSGGEPAEWTDERLVARRLKHLRERHWTMLGFSTAIVAAALLLNVTDGEHVAPLGLSSLHLPTLCGSRAMFGVDCPGCGLTRSFVALAKGDIAASFHYHHLGWLVALSVLAQFPYRIRRLRELPTIVERRWPVWFGCALIALLIGNWLGKMVGSWA